MKSRTLLICLTLIFTSTFIRAQTSLKAYVNSYYLNTQLSPNEAQLNKQNFDFFWPVIGFSKIAPNGKINEWQLGAWNYQTQTDSSEVVSTQASVRLQRDRIFWTSANNKFNAKWGLAYSLNGTFTKTTPTDSRGFDEKSNAFILEVKVFTGIEYFLSDQLFIDLSTSIVGGSLGSVSTSVLDPNIPPQARMTGGFDLNLFTNRVFRLGLGYRLNGKDTNK